MDVYHTLLLFCGPRLLVSGSPVAGRAELGVPAREESMVWSPADLRAGPRFAASNRHIVVQPGDARLSAKTPKETQETCTLREEAGGRG